MKIIIGSGIAGMICSYFNPEYIVIGNNIGGQMSSKFDLGPRYLHNSSDKIIKFLEKLKIKYKKEIIKIGYLDNTGFVNPNINFRKKYYLKSRNTESLSGFDNSVMNTDKSEIEVLNIDFQILINKLFFEIEKRFYSRNVINIDLKDI
jgi:hypothetical protein